ncbi:MAG: glucosylglycerol 3-phosphatase [Pseudomonadota bacterium]|nr:glucosylglycerol 3-phosphatase [Pseudomonadota bacterium]
MILPGRRVTPSTDHDAFLASLTEKSPLLLIQDLDGVCMALVRDPARRVMDAAYIRAVKAMAGQFYVLTNGEHIGSRGVNRIVDAAFADRPSWSPGEEGLYLPGLAAGGVQWQDCYANLTHPGVSPAEMAFLAAVPAWLKKQLPALLCSAPFHLSAPQCAAALDIIVLDNLASPTLNIGSLYERLGADAGLFRQLQSMALKLMQELQQQALAQGLEDAFFIHLAPNLGSDQGGERLKPATAADMGTTDFQFMLRGAVKEAGVLSLLNRYYFTRTGEYPLGEHFSVRTAPRTAEGLLVLAEQAFDADIMPRLVGVGDTVTSSPAHPGSGYSRGGSDRGFLMLVQRLGNVFRQDNRVVWVDSSGGELNRPGIAGDYAGGQNGIPLQALQGITDAGDPLTIDVLFPGGHRQYVQFFCRLAAARGVRV